MAYKKGRKSSKLIGSRTDRKSARHNQHRPITPAGTMNFDVSNVAEANYNRLKDTVAAHNGVITTDIKLHNGKMQLMVDYSFNWERPSQRAKFINELSRIVQNDVNHRIANPELIRNGGGMMV